MSESILLLSHNIIKPIGIVKVASFDLDNTIIFTKSKKIFSINKDDWYIKNEVLDKLKDLYHNHYKIIIFTNQGGIYSGRQDLNDFTEKCNNIMKYINLPLIIIASLRDDINRKPRTGMWQLINKNYYPNIDIKSSFYCGDAAGRNSDFSCSDYKFALNLDIPFYTPEKLFFNSTTQEHKIIDFNPNEYLKSQYSNNNEIFNIIKYYQTNMIILVGAPASGKSTFCNKYLSDYNIINQENLITLTACKKKCIEYANNSENIIIDNCNRNIKTRKIWTEIANKYNYNIIILNFNISKSCSFHINKYRLLISEKKIPNIAIYSFYKNFEIPTLVECDYLFNISFVLNDSYDPLLLSFLI